MNQRSQQLGSENIKSLLIKLSLPATVGMMVNALYNFVDAVFIGLGVSADALGGLTIAFPIQMFIMSISLMIGIGAASAVSRNLGAKKFDSAYLAAGNAYVLIIILSVLTVSAGLYWLEPILMIFGAAKAPELLPYAKDYMSVIFIGSLFFNFAVSSNNLIRAEGNAKMAMITMIIGTGLNIVLDPVFIFIFNMGIKGAAWATILSQFVSFVYILHYFLSGKSLMHIQVKHFKLHFKTVKEIITVGLSAFMRQASGSLLAIVVNNALGIYGGKVAINAFGAINRLGMFLLMPVLGIVQGMQPIVGYNYGAKKYPRVLEVVKLSLIATTVFSLFGWVITETLAKYLMRMFVADQEVIQMGAQGIRWFFLAVPGIGLQVVSATYFQSIGKAVPSLVLSALRQIILLIPLVYILPGAFGLGMLGVWIAFPISDVLSAIISAYMLKKAIDPIPKGKLEPQTAFTEE